MVSMVYHGILQGFTMIYHGLPVSKHHCTTWHLPRYIFISCQLHCGHTTQSAAELASFMLVLVSGRQLDHETRKRKRRQYRREKYLQSMSRKRKLLAVDVMEEKTTCSRRHGRDKYVQSMSRKRKILVVDVTEEKTTCSRRHGREKYEQSMSRKRKIRTVDVTEEKTTCSRRHGRGKYFQSTIPAPRIYYLIITGPLYTRSSKAY